MSSKIISISLLIGGLVSSNTIAAGADAGAPPREIGARRELLVDDYLIEQLTGNARQVLRHPEPCDVALDHNAPWEGNICAFHVVFRDDDICRMYYRASHLRNFADKLQTIHPWFICYAESRDGIHWTRPNLGLVEFNGSTDNNIILTNHCSHGFSVFKDMRPDCARMPVTRPLHAGVSASSRLTAFIGP